MIYREYLIYFHESITQAKKFKINTLMYEFETTKKDPNKSI